jgi:hypothetical protein
MSTIANAAQRLVAAARKNVKILQQGVVSDNSHANDVHCKDQAFLLKQWEDKTPPFVFAIELGNGPLRKIASRRYFVVRHVKFHFH